MQVILVDIGDDGRCDRLEDVLRTAGVIEVRHELYRDVGVVRLVLYL